MNRLKKLIYVILVIFLFGCGGSTQEQNGSAKGKRGPKSGGFENKQQSGVPVEVTFLEKGDITNQLLFSSSLETENMTEIFPKISGEITRLNCDEGDFVKKGQSLLQIDDREYQLAAKRAEVNYLQLNSELDRLKKLKNEELVSQEAFEKTRYSVEQSRLDWEISKLNLKYTKIEAPFSGVIAERTVNLGDRVQASTKLFTITNLNEKIVKIYIPQNEIPFVKLRQPAIIEADVLAGRKFKGSVKRISPMIDPQSGTFKVTIAVDDPENKILPGVFVNVALIIDSHQNAKLLPKSALVYESDRAYFFTVVGDSTQKVELQRGFDDAEKIEMLNPVEEGTRIVVIGQNGLKDGAEVKVVTYKKFGWQKKQDDFSTAIVSKSSEKAMKKSPEKSSGDKLKRPDGKKRKRKKSD